MSSDDRKKKPVEEKLEHDGSKKKKVTRSGVRAPPAKSKVKKVKPKDLKSKCLVKSVKAKRLESTGRSSAKSSKKTSALDTSGRLTKAKGVGGSKACVSAAVKKTRTSNVSSKRSARSAVSVPKRRKGPLCGIPMGSPLWYSRKPKRPTPPTPSETEETKYDDVDEEKACAARWVASGLGLWKMLLWAVDGCGVRHFGDRFEDEFDAIASHYVELHASDYVFDKDAADVAYYRRQWHSLRVGGKTRMQALSFWKAIHADRHLAWARVRVLMRRPRTELKEILKEVDLLLPRLDVPSLFPMFPLQPTTVEEYVLRYIVSHGNNVNAMVLRMPGGAMLSAKQYFSKLGAAKLVEMFAEFGADNGQVASGEVKSFAERQFFDHCAAIEKFNRLSEVGRAEAVDFVVAQWNRGKIVTNVEFLVAQQQYAGVGNVLVKAVKTGKMSSETALLQLYSGESPIVDLRVVNALTPHFKAKDKAKAAALWKTIRESFVGNTDERNAFEELAKIKTIKFGERPLHGVAMWKDTPEFDSMAPKPHSSSEEVRMDAVTMRSDKRYPPRGTREAAHSLSKTMDSRTVDDVFRQIISSLDLDADFIFAAVKDDKRVLLKGEEYVGSEFPKVEYILDRVRCSILFPNFQAMHGGWLTVEKWLRTVAAQPTMGASVTAMRAKGSLYDLFKKGFGDVKINLHIKVTRADGSVAAAVCEMQLHVAAVFEANHRAHANYDILRLVPFFVKVHAASVTPETIHTRKQLQICNAITTLKDFLDFYGADYQTTVRRLLRISDLNVADALALLKLCDDWNPFDKRSDVVAAFVEAHSQNLEKWIEFLKRCDGDAWKRRCSARGEIALMVYLRCGYSQLEVIRELLRSSDLPALTAEQVTDRGNMTAAHYLARLASVGGAPVVEELKGHFECCDELLATISSGTGAPLNEYLNHGGEQLEVARMLVPETVSDLWLSNFLVYLDCTPKRLEMAKVLFTAERLQSRARGQHAGLYPWQLYVVRSVRPKEVDKATLAFLRTKKTCRALLPAAIDPKLWNQITSA